LADFTFTFFVKASQKQKRKQDGSKYGNRVCRLLNVGQPNKGARGEAPVAYATHKTKGGLNPARYRRYLESSGSIKVVSPAVVIPSKEDGAKSLEGTKSANHMATSLRMNYPFGFQSV
jgi:hypothetical protein